jgi:hypothetical protein
MIQSLGKLLPTPGTPVRATQNIIAAPDSRLAVHGVMFQALPTNTGRVYIGTQTLNRFAFTGLYAILAVPAGSALPTFSTALTLAPNAINVADFWVDVDNGGDGVLVTVLVA